MFGGLQGKRASKSLFVDWLLLISAWAACDGRGYIPVVVGIPRFARDKAKSSG
jgi:hypothetical protein